MPVISITTSDDGVRRALEAVVNGLQDATPLMQTIGEIAHESIRYNFEVGGRPSWAPLSPATRQSRARRGKGGGKILFQTGALAAITMRPLSDRVELGTHPSASAYAAIHQYGGLAGRNHKVRIPARPYMVLQEDDEAEMQVETLRYLSELAKG